MLSQSYESEIEVLIYEIKFGYGPWYFWGAWVLCGSFTEEPTENPSTQEEPKPYPNPNRTCTRTRAKTEESSILGDKFTLSHWDLCRIGDKVTLSHCLPPWKSMLLVCYWIRFQQWNKSKTIMGHINGYCMLFSSSNV